MMSRIARVSLHQVASAIKVCPPPVILQNRRKEWINNYGEIPTYINKSDDAPWDIIVPGYPKLEVKDTYRAKSLDGIIMMPNGNHKLIIDIFTDINRRNINSDIINYRDLYYSNTGTYGEIYLHFNR